MSRLKVRFNTSQKAVISDFLKSLSVAWASAIFVVPIVEDISGLTVLAYIANMTAALSISILMLKGKNE